MIARQDQEPGLQVDDRIGAVRSSFLRQARACDRLGSPFTARVCRLAAENLCGAEPVGKAVLRWRGDPSADALALRLAGALHALALAGEESGLAAVYPPNAADDASLWRAITAAFENHAHFIARRLQSPPQTNEVRRSAALLPGFLTVAAETGLPLILSEVGASAGLNLLWDRYGYRLGKAGWGRDDSPVRIEADWQGRAMPDAEVEVIERAGCDRSPLDPSDPTDRRRLLSYIWPDQTDRQDRTRAALDLAAAIGTRVEKADAVDWLERRLAGERTGAAHVVFNTIMWQYLPEAARRAGADLIAAAGGRATEDAPLAWLQMEADGRSDGAALTLHLWPGGERRGLGRADFHGRWIVWHGQEGQNA